jgi:ATP-binding cassette subfamily B protein
MGVSAGSAGETARARAAAVSARGGTLWSTLRGLWPHMWPTSRPDLKFRVVLAFILLFGAKLSTIVMPFAFK